MDESELLPIIIHEQSKTVKYNNTVEKHHSFSTGFPQIIISFPQGCGKLLDPVIIT